MKNWIVQIHVGWRREWEETIAKHLQKKIREARENKKLSQRELSQRLERSPAYIGHVENGRLDVTVIDLVGLIAELDESLEYFLPIGEKDKSTLSAEEQEIVKHLRKIKDDATRDLAIKQVAQLAKWEKPKGKK